MPSESSDSIVITFTNFLRPRYTVGLRIHAICVLNWTDNFSHFSHVSPVFP